MHNATIFQTRPYLIAYRRHFGRGRVFHRVQLKGSCAWLQSRGKTARRLEWWGAGIHDIGDTKYFDEAAAGALWARIEAMSQQHHATLLAQVPASSHLVACAREAGWTISEAEACPVLELPTTYDEYVRSLGKNMREQIKRYPKRLEKQFHVEYQLAQTPDEVRVALDDLFRLHGKRWRARGQTGVLATPRRQAFHREVCAEFLRRGWLRLWTLRCDNRPACVLLSYCYDYRYSFFIGGFEPELMRWSVGTCLFAQVFRAAIEEGATHFDFLRGEEEYKYRFGAVNQPYQSLCFFHDSPRGRLMRARLAAESTLMHAIHRQFSAAHRQPGKTEKVATDDHSSG